MIKLIHASKIYDKSGVQALYDVDFTARRGEFVSIVGASGSGKSTLMHVLGLLDTPSAGTYLLDGEDVSHLSARELSTLRGQKIGFVFQRFQLVEGMNALENVALPLLLQGVVRPERLCRAEKALAAVGLSHRARHKPGQLSGGQQQRVAVARAIVTEPRVLLADEPTAGLDPSAASDVLDLLEALHQKGNTVVLITHDPAAACRAERRLRLEHGRLFS
ncbi:ABC transporter ATP-binding protein [Agathobaculum sp.]|uniref:ABC transporter ATP-binding protein n=1 Tax=Agathobaculum sp. TaxID=2048138 RepID=UPI002A7FF83C|nr:ABC transporter ATP-binding protein [Agathobaculum sp.]MDY3618772.1 ABC transporter ATP-binding protein [Agathobaculum sp.]